MPQGGPDSQGRNCPKLTWTWNYKCATSANMRKIRTKLSIATNGTYPHPLRLGLTSSAWNIPIWPPYHAFSELRDLVVNMKHLDKNLNACIRNIIGKMGWWSQPFLVSIYPLLTSGTTSVTSFGLENSLSDVFGLIISHTGWAIKIQLLDSNVTISHFYETSDIAISISNFIN